ncbi:hypothetical protein CYLTODRAFT_439214 [Cylindrobasidium torrendii FP15055 ss-10]|uniref:BTB domain-containing protein n=1 Tax=Cylindrobasidium torrendii FP15055 ss-10 TaxID=1314674 RepID=A0A0D7BVT2_9AGAR|nr:hypothetical protein CYLTODRAFT_439214 [Cylindrobasidium torrendii FP15055 ss-10]
MSTNPSHILIARNSRGPANTSANISSPTETHAAAAGIFRSSGSPPWLFEECETDDVPSDLDVDSDDESIEIDSTFTKDHVFPGTVKIVVETTTFWAHKEVLYFASPFFEAALSGDWAETGGSGSGRPASMSSIITISQAGDQTDATVTRGDDTDICDSSDIEGNKGKDKVREREDSLAKLEAGTHTPSLNIPSDTKPIQKVAMVKRNGQDAVVVLKEERASAFHDFLKFVYPHLQCTITWNNVESLMNISHKLLVPALQRECLTFLLTHAAGKPIKAMRIAELFGEEELYRECSRFVLDNPGGWPEQEINTLSQETLLKLEKRRNWFLERVLKIGLTQVAKEYQCCSTCPDSASCARILDEKFRQAYHAIFRIGPPQPSMVYRYLRGLEGVTPPLALTQLSCQTTAKAFIATLFDRMFALGVRGGTDTVPPRVAAAAAAAVVAGPRRHFLFCTLKPESPSKPRRSRELLQGSA